MQPQDLEPELEELLLRLKPDLAGSWRGASEREIEQVEAIVGRPLPRFYRWFLMRMGQSMGTIGYPTLRFSVSVVIRCNLENQFRPGSRLFLIGQESEDIRLYDVFYDLDVLTRDDARVVKGAPSFDTFREMLAWHKTVTYGVDAQAQRCFGSFWSDGGGVTKDLGAVMASLGFKAPIATGIHCMILTRADAIMTASSALTFNNDKNLRFRLGASDQAQIRQILGEIAAETSLKVKIDEWIPKL